MNVKWIRTLWVPCVLLGFVTAALPAWSQEVAKIEVSKDPDDAAENAKAFMQLHGVSLPAKLESCKNWSQDQEFALSFVILDQEGLDAFKKKLTVEGKKTPATAGKTDPNEFGWGPWPPGSKTYIPGGLVPKDTKLFAGPAIPVEMLSCTSTTGVFLHVDMWRVEGGTYLLRVYTPKG
jgi:hypothetical protein